MDDRRIDFDDRRARRTEEELPRVENAFTEAPKRYRSEAKPDRNGRFRLFGGEQAPAPVGAGGTVIYTPTTFDDVQMLIDHLKSREQVIVDFSKVSKSAVFRIMDFLSGAIYALDGSVQQITANIYLFAPSGVTISVPPTVGGR